MDLDQSVHAQPCCLGDHCARRLVGEQRQHHQHRVGAGKPRLDDLAGIDEEVLGEDRPVEFTPRRGEISERSAEERAIAQHAQRIRNAGIAARQLRCVGIGPDRARRG